MKSFFQQVVKCLIPIFYLVLPIIDGAYYWLTYDALFSTIFNTSLLGFLFSLLIIGACVYLFISVIMDLQSHNDNALSLGSLIVVLASASLNMASSLRSSYFSQAHYFLYTAFFLFSLYFLYLVISKWRRGTLVAAEAIEDSE